MIVSMLAFYLEITAIQYQSHHTILCMWPFFAIFDLFETSETAVSFASDAVKLNRLAINYLEWYYQINVAEPLQTQKDVKHSDFSYQWGALHC